MISLDSRANANMFSSLRLCSLARSLGPFQSAAASDDDVAAAVAVVGKMKQMAEEQGRGRQSKNSSECPMATRRVYRRLASHNIQGDVKNVAALCTSKGHQELRHSSIP